MKKKIAYKPQPDCPDCGGLHFGSYDCPFPKEVAAQYKKALEQHDRADAKSSEGKL